MARPQEWTDQSERAALARLQRDRSLVGIYLRQSKTDYDEEGHIIGVSLDQQDADCRRIPGLADLPMQVFRDEDTSGKTAIAKRPGGERLVSAVTDGSVRAVACYAQDRLGRDVKDFYDFMALCEQHGVLVFQVLGGLIRTDDEWSWGMRAFAASMQRKESRKRVLAGMRRLKEQGRVLGKIPIGYLRVNKLLVIDPEWAPRVVVIFELYASGRYSFETLARYLNDELKMPAPLRRWKVEHDPDWHQDNKWHVDGLKNMLQSPTYIGRTHVGRKGHQQMEQRDASHLAIIPLELWERCQAIRELNKKRKQAYRRKGATESTPMRHALSGIVRCARCGGAMHHQPNPRKPEQHWYRCANSYRGRTCDQRWIDANKLEDVVRQSLAYVASPDQVAPEALKRLAAASSPKVIDPKEVLRDRLKKLDSQLEAHMLHHSLGDITGERYMELRAQINEKKQAARAEAEKAPVIDINAARQKVVSLVTEWDLAWQAGPGLAGVRRNEVVREVLASVAADSIDGRPFATVTPTEAWSPLFKTLLPADDVKPPRPGWTKVADVYGEDDGTVVLVADGRTAAVGKGAKTRGKRPMSRTARIRGANKRERPDAPGQSLGIAGPHLDHVFQLLHQGLRPSCSCTRASM